VGGGSGIVLLPLQRQAFLLRFFAIEKMKNYPELRKIKTNLYLISI